MPARKRKRVYPRRRPQTQTVDSRLPDEGGLDAAARQLVENLSLEELRSLLARAQEQYDQTDREASEQPSPGALRRYRSASIALKEAERALVFSMRGLTA